MSAERPPISIGGFRGIPGTSSIGKRQQQRQHRQQIRSATPRGCAVEDAAVRLASVPFDGWEAEKEGRVRVAFDRILEHGWYDKYEANLKAVELVHINAVREHFAMRRDRIKTPDAQFKKGSNTMRALEWAANVEALSELKPGTCVRDHFTDVLRKKAAAARRERLGLHRANPAGGVRESEAAARGAPRPPGNGGAPPAASARGAPFFREFMAEVENGLW